MFIVVFFPWRKRLGESECFAFDDVISSGVEGCVQKIYASTSLSMTNKISKTLIVA